MTHVDQIESKLNEINPVVSVVKDDLVSVNWLITELRASLQREREMLTVIEWYADKNNYTGGLNSADQLIKDEVLRNDCEHTGIREFIGGKRAREYLKRRKGEWARIR